MGNAIAIIIGQLLVSGKDGGSKGHRPQADLFLGGKLFWDWSGADRAGNCISADL